MMEAGHRVRILDFISENWGFFFLLYSLIIFIFTILSYVELVKILISKLSFYMSISLAIGVTLQLLSSFLTMRKSSHTGRPFISKLLYVNIGILFYGYSVLLLWYSIFLYFIRDIVQHFIFLEYGSISALIGVLLHIISKIISLGESSQIPPIIALMIASLASVFLFYNMIFPVKLSNMVKVLFTISYFTTMLLSYTLSLKFSGSIFSSLFTTILIAVNPLIKYLVKSGDVSSLIFSTIYLCFIFLIFYAGSRDLAIGLSIIAVAVQVYFSKAFPLIFFLAFFGILVERLGSRYRRYIIYTAFMSSLLILSILLFQRLDLVFKAFRTFNLYLTILLTFSACLSIVLLLEKDVESSSRISVAFIPLILGLLVYFNESYTASIYLALILASPLITYILKSISVSRLEEELEVTIELDKFLISAPAIALFFLSIIEWL